VLPTVLPTSYKYILNNNFHSVERISTEVDTHIAEYLTKEMQEPILPEHPVVNVANSL
jgi:hypothetical protein